MDKSKKYIEMCEKAASDLGGAYDKPPDPSDTIAMEQTVGERDFEVMCGLAMWRRMAPYDPISSDRLIIKLYKQDQLQEMMSKPLWWLVWHLEEFVQKMTDKDDFQDKSMEQLWLAFVMKEKYQKIWHGKEWINGS